MTRRHWASTTVLGGWTAVVLALVAGCGGASPVPDQTGPPSSASSTVSSADPSPTTSDEPPTSPSAAPTSPPSESTDQPPPTTDQFGILPTTIQPIGPGELTGFRVDRGSATVLDARSSGLARYNTSDSCEVPGQPCYDAPTFDKVARIDLGAAPTVPGRETTFVTGHSNRYRPNDPAKGVFSRLQNVRTGDTLVLTTTRGIFVYAVTTVLSVPFDRLTSTDEVVRVRPDTVVAISCVIAPNGGPYLGNYVVVGALRGSAPR
ncbi:MAG: sortase [Lapillicoccus sp.]